MTEADWLVCADPYLMVRYLRGSEASFMARLRSWLGLGQQGRRRQLHLFACACCRRLWELVADDRSRWAVDVCERYVDGYARKRDLKRAADAAIQAAFDAESPRLAHGPWLAAAQARAAEAVAGVFDPRQGPTKGALWAREAARAVGKGARSDMAAGRASPIPLPQEVWYPWQAWGDSYQAGAQTVTQKKDADRRDSEALAGEAAWRAEGKAQCDLLREIFGNPFRLPAVAPAWRSSEVKALAQAIYQERNFERMPDLAEALQRAGCTDRELLDHCLTTQSHVRGCWVLDLLLGKS